MRNRISGSHDPERGFLTLIGLLIVIVIIGILMAMYGMPGGGGGSSGTGAPITVMGGAKTRAQGVLCQNNLQQLRVAIGIYQGNNQTFPPSLDAANAGISLNCPVGGEPYDYDPTTGQVHCVHPGHERF